MTRLSRCLPVTALAAALFLLVAFVPGARGQSPPPTWVSIGGAAEGTPAEIILDAKSSTTQQTVFDLYVHGFWKTDRIGDDGMTYQVIEVPGITSLHTLGAPDLPAAIVNVGWATNPAAVTVAAQVVTRTDTYGGILVWPQATEEQEAEKGVIIPPQFTRDQSLYSLNTIYPASRAEVEEVRFVFHTIKWASVECRPVRWNPTTKVLTVDEHLRFTVAHAGTAITAAPTTKHRTALAKSFLINWDQIDEFYPFSTTVYQGDYLFVYEPVYDNEIKPLVDQKKARGFNVTTLPILSTSHDCAFIRDLIQDWYTPLPPERDHYVLLVGDVGRIPLCDGPSGWKTDDLYADVDGNGADDVDPEVYLGRLSVDDEADLALQVKHILTYEDSLTTNAAWLDSVLLVAHDQDAPDKYEGNQEEVRTYAYSQVEPSFKTVYGSYVLSDNNDVSDAIEDGVGIVCYRGHGSSTQWWEWNLADQSWGSNEVGALYSTTAGTPVVWSFTCANSNLNSGDCLAERWMETWVPFTDRLGAVSHYGASMVSGTEQNHELNKRMWRAVFDEGLTTQSHAIAYAELWTRFLLGAEQNDYLYLLLGDPEMQVRRERPHFEAGPWTISHPSFIQPTCGTVGCCEDCPTDPLDILVLDQNGDPVQGVKVAYWKPGFVSGPPTGLQTMSASDSVEVDEALDNRYTQSDGWAHVPLVPLTPGTLYFTVTDDDGNSVTGTIPVTAQTAVGSPGGAGSRAMVLSATPSVTRTWAHLRLDGADQAAHITVFDLSGRAVRRLDKPAGARGVVWDGRDAQGRQAPTGTYVARADVGGAIAQARFVVMR